ncbi:MAG: hypothetical protein R3228_13445, partial [Halioglobus sp.]|nr:hypothetical protein [Halioglobus sp.]
MEEHGNTSGEEPNKVGDGQAPTVIPITDNTQASDRQMARGYRARGQHLHELAALRHDPEALRRSFESG